jgi:hypothetical protein
MENTHLMGGRETCTNLPRQLYSLVHGQVSDASQQRRKSGGPSELRDETARAWNRRRNGHLEKTSMRLLDGASDPRLCRPRPFRRGPANQRCGIAHRVLSRPRIVLDRAASIPDVGIRRREVQYTRIDRLFRHWHKLDKRKSYPEPRLDNVCTSSRAVCQTGKRDHTPLPSRGAKSILLCDGLPRVGYHQR